MSKKKTIISSWDELPVIFGISTVALIFDVTEVTVKHWIQDGTIKGKQIGRQWYFDKSYIQSLLITKFND